MTQRTEIDTQLSKAQRVPLDNEFRILILEKQIEHLNEILEMIMPILGDNTQVSVASILKRSKELINLKEVKN